MYVFTLFLVLALLLLLREWQVLNMILIKFNVCKTNGPREIRTLDHCRVEAVS